MAGQQGAGGGQGTPGQYHLYIHELFIRPVSLQVSLWTFLMPWKFKSSNELFSGPVSLVSLWTPHTACKFTSTCISKNSSYSMMSLQVSTSHPLMACKLTRISKKFSYILVSLDISLWTSMAYNFTSISLNHLLTFQFKFISMNSLMACKFKSVSVNCSYVL